MAPQAQSDPWLEAAKNFKAAPQSGSAPVSGNDDWKVWQQSGAEQPQQEGFLESLGHSFGIGKQESDDEAAHPVRSTIEKAFPAVGVAEGLYNGGKRIAGEVGKAFQSAKEGNGAGVGVHAVQAIPFLGPAIEHGADQLGPGENINPAEFGTALGASMQAAPMALGAADAAFPGRTPMTEPLAKMIPSKARAGKVFESVMQDAGDQPVNLSRAMDPLERAQQLSARGHGTVGAVDNLYKRINTVNPIDYREARDWASALSRISREEPGNPSPTLRSHVQQLSRAFNQDVGDTAGSVGRGEDYAGAMKEYARAARMHDILKTAGKIAIPAAIGGTAYKLGKAFQ